MTVRARRWLILGVVVLVMVGAVAVGLVWVRRARSDSMPVTVVLEATGDEGDDPFLTAPADSPIHSTLPNRKSTAVTATVDPDTGARVVVGTADRLYAASSPGNQESYGGSGSLSACDPAAIAEFLAAHPDKAAAWAQVRGIAPADIAGYLSTLTPVVLLHDTLVTNHGFANGVATPRVSVLQAGTAVLVEPTGLPVVRCACGNPLSAPPTINLPTAVVQGNQWDSYDPGGTVVVTAGPAGTKLVAVDIDSGEDVTLTFGPAPAVATSATPTTVATTTDGSDCVLDLTWPDTGPAWIDPRDSGFSCQEMIDHWQMYEQWTGERGGTMMLVDLPDGWYCTGPHRTPSEPVTAAAGGCGLGDRRFVVYEGQPGQRTPTPGAGDNSDCTLDLAYPVVGPGYIDADDAILTCQQMADLWLRYEQAAPEDREGPLALVVFDESTKCGIRRDSTSLYSSNVPADSTLVGECGVGVRVFHVHLDGAVGQATTGQNAASTTDASETAAVTPTGPVSTADLLVTPSQNILCALRNGQVGCTLKQWDFDLGYSQCQGDARGPVVQLDATGTSHTSSCKGDFFDVASWPDPTLYGTTARLGDISCDVEPAGLTCTNTEGHGFTMSRSGVTPF